MDIVWICSHTATCCCELPGVNLTKEEMFASCVQCAVSEVPQVGGVWGWLRVMAQCTHLLQLATRTERKREMIRLLAVHAAWGGWLNTTAGVSNRTSLADIIESSPPLSLSSFLTFTSYTLHISNFFPKFESHFLSNGTESLHVNEY